MKTRSSKALKALLLLCVLCLALGRTASAEEPEAPADPPVEEPAQPEEEKPEEEKPEGEDEERELPEGGKKPAGRTRSPGKDSGRITPGKALNSTHASGERSMVRHGAVVPEAGADSMRTLVLGGEELALTCGGSAFTASVEGDVLALRSEEGDAWSLTMDVLRTLNLSGIRELKLAGPETETVLDTALELTGALYGKERAQGFVSADFRLLRQDGEWLVRVDGREYRLSGNELLIGEES